MKNLEEEILMTDSGTTGMPKACSFPIERHFLVMAAVRKYALSSPKFLG